MNRYATRYPNICKLDIHEEALEAFIDDLPAGRRMLLEVSLKHLISQVRQEERRKHLMALAEEGSLWHE